MKIQRMSIHLAYSLVILTLIVGMIGMNGLRISAKNRLKNSEEIRRESVVKAFERLTAELSGDLYSMLEADTRKLYLMKLNEIQVSIGQAQVLLSENGRQTPWISFWDSLGSYMNAEVARVSELEQLNNEVVEWKELAILMAWLSENPSVILDESTESLPEDLHLPTLQTAYSVSEEITLRTAERVFGVKGGLRSVKDTSPGIRSYACNNGRADLMQSGELIYFSLRLKSKEGDIGDDRAVQVIKTFARENGMGDMELIDLYREDNRIVGKLVPKISAEQLGRILDLDRVVEIACTAWSGRVCYFSAGKYYAASQSTIVGLLMSPSKLEKLASEKGAQVGSLFRYKGKICRSLIYRQGEGDGHSVLCVDAVSGEALDLFYVQRYSLGAKLLF